MRHTDTKMLRILCQLYRAHGIMRFSLRQAHVALCPKRPPAWLGAGDAERVKGYLVPLVKSGLVIEREGPRGGEGWAVSVLGAFKADQYALTQHPHFQVAYFRDRKKAWSQHA